MEWWALAAAVHLCQCRIGAAVALTVYQRRWSGIVQLSRRYAWLGLYFVLILLPIIWSNRYFPDRQDEGPIWTDAVRQKMFLALPLSVFVIVSSARAISRFQARRGNNQYGQDSAGFKHTRGNEQKI